MRAASIRITSENIRIDTDNRSAAILLMGIKHGDNTTNPGQAPWLLDCENNVFRNCVFGRAQLAPFTVPNQGGQTRRSFSRTATSETFELRCQPLSLGNLLVLWRVHPAKPGVGYCDVGVTSLGCEQMEIENANLESCGRFLRGGNITTGGQLCLITGGRISLNAMHADGKMIKFYGAGTLVMNRVYFDGTYSASFAIEANNAEDGTERSLNVTAIGCIFPNNAPFATPPAGTGVIRTVLGCATNSNGGKRHV